VHAGIVLGRIALWLGRGLRGGHRFERRELERQFKRRELRRQFERQLGRLQFGGIDDEQRVLREQWRGE
jgi:hypothetical protein